jgi:hypothetical protein
MRSEMRPPVCTQMTCEFVSVVPELVLYFLTVKFVSDPGQHNLAYFPNLALKQENTIYIT